MMNAEAAESTRNYLLSLGMPRDVAELHVTLRQLSRRERARLEEALRAKRDEFEPKSAPDFDEGWVESEEERSSNWRIWHSAEGVLLGHSAVSLEDLTRGMPQILAIIDSIRTSKE